MTQIHLLNAAHIGLNGQLLKRARARVHGSRAHRLRNLRLLVLRLERHVLHLGNHLRQVQHDLEAAGAVVPLLPAHDVGRNAAHLVQLRMARGLQEHLRRLLKRRLGNGTNVVIVDAVPENGHHARTCRHAVAQQAQVVVIDVRAVVLKHARHLRQKRLARGLNAQHAANLLNVVADRAAHVNVVQRQHVHQVGPLRV